MVHHTCMSIEGGIRNASMLKGCITVDGVTLDTVVEIKKYLRGQIAEGKRVLPMCDCLGFDFQKGCPGHDKEEADKHEAVMKIARAICDCEKTCDKYCGLCDDCKPYKDALKIYKERKG